MPIIANFPKREIYASNLSRGLMSRDDVSFLHSIQEKLNSVGDIIGRKIYAFNSIADMTSSINLSDGDIAITLGSTELLDDGYIKIFKISSDEYWLGSKDIVTIPFNNLYGKLVIKLVDGDTIKEELATILSSFDTSIESHESEIASIIVYGGNANCKEVNDKSNQKQAEARIPQEPPICLSLLSFYLFQR